MLTEWQEQWWLSDEERRAAMMALPTLEVRHHAVIAPAAPDDVRMAVSVGPAGEVIALWCSAAERRALIPTAMERRTPTARLAYRATRPVTVRVAVYTPQPTITRIPGMQLAPHKVQRLPQGGTLVVGATLASLAQVDYFPLTVAAVYDNAGSVVAEGVLGHGIAHIYTSTDGYIWVGYSDEGIFFSCLPDGSPNPGACGLARFTPDLQLDWRFGDTTSLSTNVPSIYDCYALNIDGNTTWTCYYDDFSIVRIEDGVLTRWRNDVFGAEALAVDGDRIALYGGYGPVDGRLVVGTLSGGRMHATGEYRLTLPTGQPLAARTRVIGRGPDLHIITETDWYRLSLDDIATGWPSAKLYRSHPPSRRRTAA
ncbi:hypothetical protein ACWF82_19575 [Nocardia sp. NPDC055053]